MNHRRGKHSSFLLYKRNRAQWRALSQRVSLWRDDDLASGVVLGSGSNSRCEERKHQSAWECFPFADSPTCLFWPGSFFRKRSFSRFSLKNWHVFQASIVSVLPSSLPSLTYLFVHKLSEFQSCCACLVTDEECCPMAAVGKSQMWGNWFLLRDWVMLLARRSYTRPPWIVWEIALPSLMETRLGEQGSGGAGEIAPPPPPPAPEGSSQACAINFLTIYSQVEFIFPEEPHMWCISGFRLWGWGRRRLWSQSIKVATNSVFLEGRLL